MKKKEEKQKEEKQKRKEKWCVNLFNFQNGRGLANFVRKIPNIDKIKFKLSQQEQDVVAENENMIVVGRSGTGKTTCALMRLFAIQVYFQDQLARKEYNANSKVPYHFRGQDLNIYSGIKNIFLTASSHLIKSINRQYKQLKEHLQNEIQKKDLERATSTGQGTKQKQNEKEENEEQYGLEQILDDQRQQEERQKKYISFTKLNQEDFPGFFSIREFIIMLDGCLMNPFFCRNQDRSLKTKSQGNRRKYQINLNNTTMYAQECTWDIFLKDFWPTIFKKMKDIRKRYRYPRVNNWTFKAKNQQQKEIKEITPIGAWTQIISTIQGSCQAHICEGQYLTLDKYLKQSKNIFYGQIQRKIVYDIFHQYRFWKLKQAYYDSMDLVNHLLLTTQKVRSSDDDARVLWDVFGDPDDKPQFNYLLLDQVQDLPPAAIYLISILFGNGLYYAGDTAQAIQKGVAFSFADIQEMHGNQNFAIDTVSGNNINRHNLTVNYRSHNQILSLANNVVQLLSIIFKGSIDKLRKESAQNDGPKPVVFGSNQGVKTITKVMEQHIVLLTAEEMKDNKPEQIKDNKPEQMKQKKSEQLGLNQLVIVRNSDVKNKVKNEIALLKLKYKIQVLTIQQCKGLQYNDVILYNVFDPSIADKWKILKYTHLYPKRGTASFNLWEINPSDYDVLITQLKMLYTIITRTRCSLFICDSNIPEHLMHIWNAHDLLGIANEAHQALTRAHKQKHFSKDKQSWDKKGFIFYQRGNLEGALQNYERAFEQTGKHENVCFKLRAEIDYRKAEEKLESLEKMYNIKEEWHHMDYDDLPANNNWVWFQARCREQVFSQMKSAGVNYQKIQLFDKAAECYEKCQQYEMAIKMHEASPFQTFFNLGWCHKQLGNFNSAAEYFLKAEEYNRCFKCLQAIQQYQKCLYIVQEQPRITQREYFFRKYRNILANLEYQKLDKKYGVQGDLFDIYDCGQQAHFEKIKQLQEGEELLENSLKTLKYIPQFKFNKKIKIGLQKIKILEQIKHLETLPIFEDDAIVNFFELASLQNISKIKLNQLSRDARDAVNSIDSKLNIIIKAIEQKYEPSQSESQIIVFQYCVKSFNQTVQNYRQLLQKKFKSLLNKAKNQIQTFYSLKLSKEDPKINLTNLRQYPFSYSSSNLFSKKHQQTLLFIQSSTPKDLKILTPKRQVFSIKAIWQRENIPQNAKRSMNHRYLSHLALQRQLNFRKIDKYRLDRLNELQLVAPRAYLHEADQLGLREHVIQAIIWCLSYSSRNYLNKSTIGSKVRVQPTSNFKLISLLNADYFNFDILKTKYSRTNALNQILEAAIFLGFWDQVANKCSQSNQTELTHIFANQEQLFKKIKQPGIKLLIQYRQFDQGHPNAWLCPSKINNYLLTEYYKETIRQRVTSQIRKNNTTQNDYNKKVVFPLKDNIIEFMNNYNKFRQQSLTDPKRKQYLCDIRTNQMRLKQKQQKQQIQLAVVNPSKVGESLSQMIRKIYQSLDQLRRFSCQCENLKELSPFLKQIEKSKDLCRLKFKLIQQYFLQAKKSYSDTIRRRCYELRDLEIQKVRNNTSLSSERKSKIYFQINKINYADIYAYVYTPIIPKNFFFDFFSKDYESGNQILSHFVDRINLTRQTVIFQTTYFKLQQKIEAFTNNFMQDWRQLQHIRFIVQEILSKDKNFNHQHQFQQNFRQIEKQFILIQKLRTTILDYPQYMNKKMQVLNLLISEAQKLLNDTRVVTKELTQIQNALSTQIQQEVLQEYTKAENQKKQMATYKMQLQSKIQIQVQMGQVSAFSEAIFFKGDISYLVSEIIIKDKLPLKAEILLIYLSYHKYSYLRSTIKDRVHKNHVKVFEQKLQQISNNLRQSFITFPGFIWFTSLLELFECHLITNEPFMSIYKYFVVANQKSPLIRYLQDHRKFFCYYIDQKRQTVLITLNDLLLSLEHAFNIKVTTDDRRAEKVISLLYNLKSQQIAQITQSMLALIKKIQQNRETMFSYLGDNIFVTHQTSLLVYHQLKCYADMLELIGSGSFSTRLDKTIRKNIEELESEFEEWKGYADKYEIAIQ